MDIFFNCNVPNIRTIIWRDCCFVCSPPIWHQIEHVETKHKCSYPSFWRQFSCIYTIIIEINCKKKIPVKIITCLSVFPAMSTTIIPIWISIDKNLGHVMCSSLVVLVQKISRRNVIDLLGGVTINQGEIYQAIRIKNNKELKKCFHSKSWVSKKTGIGIVQFNCYTYVPNNTSFY